MLSSHAPHRLLRGLLRTSSVARVQRPLGLARVLVAGLAAGCTRAPAPAEPQTAASGVTAAGLASGTPAVEAAPSSAPRSPEPAAVEVSSASAVGHPVPPSPSPGCGRPSKGAGALVARAGKLQTPFLLTLPEGYDGTRPVPLAFAFHGRTRSHQSMHDTDASQLAAELGPKYAIAYVKSIGPGFDWPHEQRDNLQIFDALYERLLGEYCIDTEQVFALGHSSGGLFSELLSCQRGEQLRGIAAVAGAMTWPECPGRAAALLIHGERDAVVSISRGHAARDHFREANACTDDTTTIGAPGCVAYSGCEPALPVEWCVHAEPTYQNTNHGWPAFASAEIARFFGTLGRVPHPGGSALLANESFDAGSEPWQVTFMGKARGTWAVRNGALCATVDAAGDNPWDAQLAYPGLKLEAGHEYAIDYRVWTSAPSDVRIRLGLEAAPYDEYWQQSIEAGSVPRRVTRRFTLVEAPPGALSLAFQFAGPYARKVPITLCIDEVGVSEAPTR
jgi:polyhydroxybutyrate depolymerase